MAYCIHCGSKLVDGAEFCANCGAEVTEEVKETIAEAETEAAEEAVDTESVGTETENEYIEDYVEEPEEVITYDSVGSRYVNNESGIYSVILLATGYCDRRETQSILHEVLDYTLFSANEIVNEMPAEIACGLSYRQAVCLAQVLTEYGVEVAIFNGRGYVDPGRSALTTVFEENGRMLTTVAALLATIGVAHRVTGHWRFRRGNPMGFGFHLRYSFERRRIGEHAPRQLIHEQRRLAGPGGRQAQVIQPERRNPDNGSMRWEGAGCGSMERENFARRNTEDRDTAHRGNGYQGRDGGFRGNNRGSSDRHGGPGRSNGRFEENSRNFSGRPTENGSGRKSFGDRGGRKSDGNRPGM